MYDLSLIWSVRRCWGVMLRSCNHLIEGSHSIYLVIHIRRIILRSFAGGRLTLLVLLIELSLSLKHACHAKLVPIVDTSLQVLTRDPSVGEHESSDHQ